MNLKLLFHATIISMVILFQLTINVYSQELNYIDYLKQLKVYKEIDSLILYGNYEVAQKKISELKQDKIFKRNNYLYKWQICKHFNNTKHCKSYLQKALSNGYRFGDNLEHEVSKFQGLDLISIKRCTGKYIRSIDTVLRNKIANVSYYGNQTEKRELLYTIVAKNGWPGVMKIGYDESCSEIVQPNRVLSLMYSLTLEDYNYLYPIIIRSCVNSNESWANAEQMMFMFYHKQVRKEQLYSPLQHVIVKNAKIDFHESFFQLVTFLSYISLNTGKTTIFIADKFDKKTSDSLMSCLQNFFLSSGIDPNSIVFELTPIIISQSEFKDVIFWYHKDGCSPKLSYESSINLPLFQDYSIFKKLDN